MKRVLIGIAITLAAVVVALSLFLAFADLSRYRGNIETLVTKSTGRQLRIEGDFELEAFPPSLVAEGISFAGAEWSDGVPMLTAGHMSMKVDLRSVLTGPVVVEDFRLHDVELLLEENAEGEYNWSVDDEQGAADIEVDPGDTLPAIVQFAELRNIQIIYRRPELADHVITLASFDVKTTNENYLSAEGVGAIDDRGMTISSAVGPIDNLHTGADLDVDLQADIGLLALEVSGNTGNPYSMAGTKIHAVLTSVDTAALLAQLELPIDVSGELRIEAELAEIETGPAISFHAVASDLEAGGVVSLEGEQINFFMTAASLARFAEVAGVPGLPEGEATLRGGVEVDGDNIELIEVAIETPEVNLTANADAVFATERITLNSFSVRSGESDIEGELDIELGEPLSVSGDLRSSVLDLTPFMDEEDQEASEPQVADDATEGAVAEPPPDSGGLVFSEEPLPFDFLNAGSVDLEIVIEKFMRGPLVLEQVEGSAQLHDGTLSVESGFAVGGGGSATGTLSLVSDGDSANANVEFAISDLRVSLGQAGDRSADQIPLLGLSVDVTTAGDSMHTLAAGANGKVLFTQGPGQVDNSAMGFFSADIISELFSALNPFAKEEPYSAWECTVFALNIVDGVSTIEPMLAQSEKLTIVGDGTIDLNDESLDISFNTKPRQGVGVSADMFVTPFIRLGGTLGAARLALDKSGIIVSGGAAILTGGISFFVQGAADRASGATDRCAAALALAKGEVVDVEE